MVRHLSETHEVLAWGRAELDLAEPDSIRKALAESSFDVLVNCAALTAVDYCETHREEAVRLNAEAVEIMAAECARAEARLVQISTDYVFDGEKDTPYHEKDEARPLSVYGESKRLGEVAALAGSSRNLVVRVSWVYGPDRPAFPDMILRRALENDQVEAIADKVSTPASTLELAPGIEALISAEARGIVHLCDGGSCTWQEYGQAVLDAARAAGLPLKAETVGAITLSELTAFVAKRPRYTAMTTDRFTQWTGLTPRAWAMPLAEFVREHLISSRARC